MMSRLVYMGVTHRTAPVEVREHLVINKSNDHFASRRMKSVVQESVVLSTCGRFEGYFFLQPNTSCSWATEIADAYGFGHERVRSSVRTLRAEDAARHLLSVATGIDSQVVGERNILSQVRHTYALGQEKKTVGPVLSALFRAGIHAGRISRKHATHAQDASSLAALVASRVVNHRRLTDSPDVVVVGGGEMALSLARELLRTRTPQLSMIVRDPDRVKPLVRHQGIRVDNIHNLPGLIPRRGSLIVCTSSPRFVVSSRTLAGVSPTALFVADLSVPRNVDPHIGCLPGVQLQDLDEIVSSAARQSTYIEHAQTLVNIELNRFKRWLQARQTILDARSVGLRKSSQRRNRASFAQRATQVADGMAA
jgi:glutamyl-tRNA reductase